MSIVESNPNYAGVPLPEVRIQCERLLLADSTEKLLNALIGVDKIRQINLKGESLPSTINSGPHRGIANNHSERKIIKFGDREVELKHLVGDFLLELAVENQEELEMKVKEIDQIVKPIIPFGYTIEVGRYSKYRPSLHDYKQGV
ncbi:MAG: methyl-coenzyme M reductase operon protein D [archaeon]|nr:methyl-coenzyme M reductase operon protein D [archaeon]